MKKIVVLLLILSVSVSFAQKKPKPSTSVGSETPTAGTAAAHPVIPPNYVAVDGDQVPPPFTFNISDLHFGSQGIGVESCMYVTITNSSNAAQTMPRLSVDDEKRYSIPSPSQKMLPISIQPKSNLTISVCFKPEKVGDFKTRLVIRSGFDSSIIPIDGKGIKPEDVGKLPKTEFTVTKKKHEWNLRLQLVSPAKINLQLFDDLGNSKFVFLNNDFKNEGLYEFPFDGLDKDKQKIPPGTYYIRCVAEDLARSSTPLKFTKMITVE